MPGPAIRFWAPSILWALCISLLSSIPDAYLHIEIYGLDKAAHLFEYFVLGFLLLRSIINSSPNIRLSKAVFLSIIIASLYAVLDEWHQKFVPGRTSSYFDLLADMTGLDMGIIMYRYRWLKCRK